MAEAIFPTQPFESPSKALAHYGVLGMRWGVRKTDAPGVSRSTNKEAAKDAAEFARAKMFYGEGAGTRRKLIRATVSAKSKKDPNYAKAFEHHLAQQDMSKHAEKARSERRRKDVSKSTGKTVRGAHRYATGGMGNVTLAGAILGGAVLAGHQAGIDKAMADAAKTKYRQSQQSRQSKKAVDDLLRDMGMK